MIRVAHLQHRRSLAGLVFLDLGRVLGRVPLTCGDAVVLQAALVVQTLALHGLRPDTRHAGHGGVGALQPRHQPLGPAVALEGVAPQVPADVGGPERAGGTGANVDTKGDKLTVL